MKYGACAAVLFDLDDTLVDSTSAFRRETEALTEVIRKRHPRQLLEAFFERFNGYLLRHHEEVDTGRVSVVEFRERRLRYALSPWGDPDLDLFQMVAACLDATSESLVMLDGAARVLRKLRDAGVSLGIVTNGPREIQMAKCLRLGLAGLVDAIVTSEDVGRTKPDAAVFLEALRRLNVGPQKAVVVGDSWENDVIGGLQAGLAGAIHVNLYPDISQTSVGLLGTTKCVGDEMLRFLEGFHV